MTVELRTAWAWISIGLLACKTTAEIPACPPRQDQKPPIPGACVEQAEQRYIGQAASQYGDHLMGWRSHPGTATLSIEFAMDSTVESVCLREVSGSTVKARVRRAAASVSRQPAAPACFAGHRVDLSWESPRLTDEHIRSAKAECQASAASPRRALHFCWWSEGCTIDEVRHLKRQADERFAVCVIGQVPITMRSPGTKEMIYFRPGKGASPNSREAISALERCEDSRDRASLTQCMLLEGWERVE
jgi:hypothetical protein